MNAAETFAPLMRGVATDLLGKPDHANGNGKTLRWRTRGSLKVEAEDGTWFDHEAKQGGGVLDLIMRERSCDKAGALQWLETKGHIDPRERGEPVRYPYHDAEGRVLYAKVRVDKPDRKYEYQHPVANGWRAGRGKIGAVPYRLPQLLAAAKDAVLYMAEGEKKADKLASWGLLATSHKDWRAEYAEHVIGRTVIILPDNDKGGAEQAADAARLVKAARGRPVIVELPDLPAKGDIMDWRGTREDLAKLVAKATADAPIDTPAFKRGISAAALMAKHFEPVNYVIPGLLAEGAWILAGPPKLGKSWLCYDFALAIAAGRPVFGSIPVSQGDVLYLALEDSERRLKSRLLKKGIRQAPERLTLSIEWPGLDDGCIAELEAWADAVAKPSMVIIDVLKMVRGAARANETVYDADYRALTGLATFARARGIVVVVVHHTRKMAAEDPLESISGTNGLTGCADGVMVLKRDIGTGNCTLYVRGRDIEESETALQFDRDIGTWQRLGAADEVGRTSERENILATLRQSDKPLTARDISDILGKSYDAVRKTLNRMAHAGEIEKQGRSLYTCPNGHSVSNTPSNHTQWDIVTDGTGDESGDWIGESPAQTASRIGRPMLPGEAGV
ncbi:AAA family ATPase [Parafrankia sp. BMG5.11]|uniref:AAA family ATPase n=1 Tax=Parafrankia sp. BMG5.11 TaxID=222540 RepID=UPI001404E81C|nr:AAA family ATPase [Parafrankia sp. BMG5.11]